MLPVVLGDVIAAAAAAAMGATALGGVDGVLVVVDVLNGAVEEAGLPIAMGAVVWWPIIELDHMGSLEPVPLTPGGGGVDVLLERVEDEGVCRLLPMFPGMRRSFSLIVPSPKCVIGDHDAAAERDAGCCCMSGRD